MNWLDIAIIVCIIIGIVHGMISGIVKQIISVVSLIIAVFLSGTVAKLISSWMRQHFQTINDSLPPNIQNAIYYILAFILIVSLFALAAKLLDSVINHTPLGIINRLFGALSGIFFWALCLSIALNFVVVFDTDSRIISTPVKENSILYEPVRMLFPMIFPYIEDFLTTK